MVKYTQHPAWSLKKHLHCLEDWQLKNTSVVGLLKSLGENLIWMSWEFNMVKANVCLVGSWSMAQKLSIQRAHNMCLYWISIFLEIGFLDASHDFVRLQVMSTWISFEYIYIFFGQLYFFIYDKCWMLNELSNQPIHKPYQVAVWTWFNSDWLLGLCWYLSLAPVLFCYKDGIICLQSEIYSLVLWLSDGNVSLLLQINMWRKWDCSWVCYSSYGLLTWLLELSNNGVPPKYKYRGQGCVTGQLEIAFSWSTERNRVWLPAHSLCGFLYCNCIRHSLISKNPSNLFHL